MSETSMWLFTVVMAAAVGLFVNARAGMRWMWGLCLQQAMILSVSLLGFYFLYAPTPWLGRHGAEQAADACSWLAWLMFLGFNICQRLMLNNLSLDLSLLKVKEANLKTRYVRWLSWGPPGQYWTAVAQALALYQAGEQKAADALIAKWQADPDIPAQSREGLLGCAMLGRVLHGDYDGVIRLFEKNQGLLARTRAYSPLQLSSRAFAEKEQYAESLACLVMMFDQTTRLSTATIDINFIPFFALSGACKQLANVFASCKDKHVMPEYSRLFWLGRCHAVRGDSSIALTILAEAKAKTPESMTMWHERLDNLIESQQQIAQGLKANTLLPATKELIDQAARVYARWRVAADVVRPASARPGLVVMMVALIVAFVLSNPYEFFGRMVSQPSKVYLVAMQVSCLKVGQLDSNIWNGQWWRMISYMFLHGNTAHLALNTGALYLFGKSVENMFGTPKFLVIFFGAGILSGLFQLIIMPNEPAIGASGAILGVFGAAIAGMVKLKDVLPPHIRRSELKWMLSVAVLQVIFDQVVNNIAALTDKTNTGIRIAAFAHIGGIVAGFAIGMLLPLRRWKEFDTVDSDESKG